MQGDPDDGIEELPNPGISQMSEAEAAEHIYMMYRRARKHVRRFTDRPARAARRAFWHSKGKSKGKGKSRGHRSHSSGKGHGSKGTHETDVEIS